MSRLTNRSLFRGMDGRTFSTYGQVVDRFLENFNGHMMRGEIPPGLHYNHILDWAERRRILIFSKEGYKVDLSKLEVKT